MLDATLTQQLATHLEKVVHPIELVASLGDDPTSAELRDLLTQIAGLSDLVSFDDTGSAPRRPSFEIRRTGTDIAVAFGGVPLGHEFTSLVLALLQVGGHPPRIDDDVADAIRALPGTYDFVTYFSLSCQNCPDVVQALNAMSVINPAIRHTAIDGAVFGDEVEARQILSVPAVFLDDELFDTGRMGVEQILARIDTEGAARRDQALADRGTFDVLIVGGGPAGAAAAIYAARKGIATGVVAERFGGQVLDTMGIENLISTPYTEGPKLASALENLVRDHDVDVMDLQQAVELRPAERADDPIEVVLASGVALRSKTVVLSTGARWRQLGVPGEDEYRNRGVAYCPHCDGPLFKGRRVAVVGGGNSGIEAAIDLAGIVGHVTVLEFDDSLRADEVLQAKLASLDNVTVHTGAQTTEITGDGTTVDGLRYRDRSTGEEHVVDLEGVFVQIGLLPNTEWLDGVVETSDRGEIVIDDHGRTSVPGVFAAGDCTTVPYKQIVISMGAGSTAALSAFDHLIRTSAPVAV